METSDTRPAPTRNGSGQWKSKDEADDDDDDDERSVSDDEDNESHDDTQEEDGGSRRNDDDETDAEKANDDDTAAKVEEDATEEGPERALIKGRWTCTVCAKDEFCSFIDACVHEAYCAKMVFKQVDPV